jgi:hypothetical protein
MLSRLVLFLKRGYRSRHIIKLLRIRPIIAV